TKARDLAESLGMPERPHDRLQRRHPVVEPERERLVAEHLDQDLRDLPITDEVLLVNLAEAQCPKEGGVRRRESVRGQRLVPELRDLGLGFSRVDPAVSLRLDDMDME